jgi:hypothetical protein
MASYRIVIEKNAASDLLAVPFPMRRQINQRIFKLKSEPELAASEVLFGSVRWVPVYGWHIVYEVDEAALVVTIFAII